MECNGNEAKKFFEPHLEDIKESIVKGFNRYSEIPAELRIHITPRSRSSLRNDFIVAEVRKRWHNSPEICELRNIRGLFIVDFGGYQLRFKKVNKKFQSQNIPTRQTLSFMIQDPLPGMPPAENLIAGYRPDKFQNSIQSIAIVCPNGKSYHYFLPICIEPETTIPLRDYEEPVKESKRVTAKEDYNYGDIREEGV